MSTVLVTGAGSGLGRRTALRLAANGHRVVAGVLDDAELAALAGTGVEPVRLDITDAGDRATAAALPVDVLVNNAGIPQAGPLRAVPLDLVRRAFDVNVLGTLALTQAVVPGMRDRGGGRVLVMSSIAGLRAGPFTGPYAMTKHALQAMASALRHELAPSGIDVALVNPGPFATGFNDRMVADSLGWYDPDGAWSGELEMLEQTRRRVTGAQLDPELAVDRIVELVEAPTTELVNLVPPDLLERLDARPD